MSHDVIWKAVKEIRLKNLKLDLAYNREGCYQRNKKFSLQCMSCALFSDNDFNTYNGELLEEQLGVNSSLDYAGNIDEKSYEEGAKAFIYLNSCFERSSCA